MRKINYKKLLKLPVEDVLGNKIGTISGFDIDVDSQRVIVYYVNAHAVVRIVSQELTIHSDQVVSISNEKMVVDDMSIKEGNKKTATQAVPV